MNHAPTNSTTHVKGIRRLIYVGLAALFFGLGMVGVVLPGIPTTPFLLLMSYFLIRVSPQLHARVLAWPVVGKPIREWQEKGGVRPGVKMTAYAMVLFFVGLSVWLGPFGWSIRIAIMVTAALGVWVVYRLPTIAE